MLRTILHHPRKLWLRKAVFQIHLWAGILLSLYVVVIGLSGSLLVFQDEIRRASLPPWSFNPSQQASVNAVIAHAQQHFPGGLITYIDFPKQPTPWWTIYVTDTHGKDITAYADPQFGIPLDMPRRLFIDWTLDLHVYLLAGRTGFIVNCVAGIGLLLLAITGAILWWPGVRLWKRALSVALNRGWKRINYDLHSAVGIWTLGIVCWWGLTAVYFLFPRQTAAMVNAVSPLEGMKEPTEGARATDSTKAVPLEEILRRVSSQAAGSLAAVGLPDKPGGDVRVYFDLGEPGDFSHRDIYTIDGHRGKTISLWHYGRKRSLGDWLLWLVYPLHFGTLWGVGVKVLWASLGLTTAALSITGLLMYWNRKLSKLFKLSPEQELLR